MDHPENIDIAHRFMDTYAVGDPDGLVACLADDWLLHDADGGTSTAEDVAEITRLQKVGFPDKNIEYVLELAHGDLVAQYLIFTTTHAGPYFDLEPTGNPVRLEEMIFHRLESGRPPRTARRSVHSRIASTRRHTSGRRRV